MTRPRRRAYHALVCAAAAAVLVVELDRFSLDNGLALVVAPRPGSAVVALQAWVAAGSADEGPGQAGVAHLLEHMLFKGTARRGVGDIAGTIEAAGGDINAWTSFDHTVLHAVLPRSDWELGLDVIGDALVASRFDPDELEREREVVLEEIRQGMDDPVRAVAHALFGAAHVAHPYRRPVIGSAESVAGLGHADLVDYFRTWYVAGATTLVVAGDVDPAAIRRAARRHLGALPAGAPPRRRPVEPAQTAIRTAPVERAVAEAQLAIGFRTPPPGHADSTFLDLAAVVLGQGESSRLPRAVVREQELATGAWAYLHALRDGGMFVVGAAARPDAVRELVTRLAAETARLAGDLDDAELDKARTAVESEHVFQLETAPGVARRLGWWQTTTGDVGGERDYLARIRAATPQQVRAAVHRYLRADAATVATVGPRRRGSRAGASARRLAEAVRAGARSGTGRKRAARAAEVVRTVLPNGTVLLVKPDPGVPVVAMRAVWPGGVRLETPRSNGVTTLLSHVITRGCADRGGDEIADLVDRLGGGLAGAGGRNSFGLRAEWLARTWEEGLDLLADCILEPRFEADEIARARRRLLDAIDAQADSPGQVAFRLFAETLYRSHPYRLDPMGSPASVAGLSRAQVADFYKSHFPPSAMTLAIVGDVDPEQVLARVRARFAEGRRARAGAGPRIATERFTGRAASEREVYRYLEREQAHLVVGFPGTTVASADRFALEVLTTILGGQSGRLFVELRDRQSLAYRLSAHSVEGLDPGYVAIYLSCTPAKLDAAVGAVRGELDRLLTGGVTAAEVERAQRYLVGAHAVALERRSAVATALAFHEAYGLGWAAWARYPEAIDAVTADDVARVARRYLRWDLAVTATVRPPAMTPGAEERARGKSRGKPHPRPPRRRPAPPPRNA